MIQLNAELHHIDYEKLLSRIQDAKEKQAGIPYWLVKIAGKLLTSNIGFIMKPITLFTKNRISVFAEGYGIYFTELSIKDVTLIRTENEGGNMLDISVSIEKIDWDKLVSVIGGISNRAFDNNGTLPEVVRIIKPFVNETMATIPLNAIAELFDLLVKDKVVGLAEDYGVTVSEISVKP